MKLERKQTNVAETQRILNEAKRVLSPTGREVLNIQMQQIEAIANETEDQA